jgi:8-oxo-dGTP pyrophosphatase MutT (NUDIX family)
VRFYYLPGGHIETRESPKDALFPELKEELRMLAVIGEFLGKFSNSWGFFGDDICCHTHEINFIFKAEIQGLSALQIPKQQEDHVAFGWIDLNNLSHTDLRPSFLKKNIHGI